MLVLALLLFLPSTNGSASQGTEGVALAGRQASRDEACGAESWRGRAGSQGGGAGLGLAESRTTLTRMASVDGPVPSAALAGRISTPCRRPAGQRLQRHSNCRGPVSGHAAVRSLLAVTHRYRVRPVLIDRAGGAWLQFVRRPIRLAARRCV
jgi:hypothetical protein